MTGAHHAYTFRPQAHNLYATEELNGDASHNPFYLQHLIFNVNCNFSFRRRKCQKADHCNFTFRKHISSDFYRMHAEHIHFLPLKNRKLAVMHTHAVIQEL